jgi:hypothetical protein
MMGNDQENALAEGAGRLLPTIEEIRAMNPRADGKFKVLYDGGGEYVLRFIDKNGTQAGRPGEPIERWIHTFRDGCPDPEEARAWALAWLNENYYCI